MKLRRGVLEAEFLNFLDFLKSLKQEDFSKTQQSLLGFLEAEQDSELKYLMTLFADNYFLNYSNFKEKWMTELLETKLYGTLIGGSNFITRFHQQSKVNSAMRDMYLLANKLGYQANLVGEIPRQEHPFICGEKQIFETPIKSGYYNLISIAAITFLFLLIINFIELRQVVKIVNNLMK